MEIGMGWQSPQLQPHLGATAIRDELARLEGYFATGHLSREGYLEAVARVQERAFREGVLPLQRRAAWAALAGSVLMGSWFTVEFVLLDLADTLGDWPEALALLGTLILFMALAFLGVAVKREAEFHRWFNGFGDTRKWEGGRPLRGR
jgi:hypothetical protein